MVHRIFIFKNGSEGGVQANDYVIFVHKDFKEGDGVKHWLRLVTEGGVGLKKANKFIM